MKRWWWCLGPFFHEWGQWEDGIVIRTTIMTEHHGVRPEQVGQPYTYKRLAQTRYCSRCGRRQTRLV